MRSFMSSPGKQPSKKTRLCFLILSFLSVTALKTNGQNIFYSREEKFSFQSSDFSVIGRTGDRIFTYSASKEGFYLNIFNDSMRMVAKVALDFFPQKVSKTEFVNYPDGLVVLYQALQSNYIVQYAARLDERGLLKGRPVAIDSVKTSWFGGGKSFFSTSVSEDKDRIMVYGLGKEDFSAALLDGQLRILHKGHHRLDMENNVTFVQSLLDNSGRFYLTAVHESGSKNYSDDFRLLTLSPDGSKLEHKSLPLQGKFLSGTYSKLNTANHNIYSAAFYSRQKLGNLEGVSYFVYSPDSNGFRIQKDIPFDESIQNDAGVRNKKKAFNDYEVRKLILKNDGGFVLVSENAYVTTRTTMTPGFGYYSWYYDPLYADRSVREYHFGDIFTLDFDQAGHILWHSFIRKDQNSQEDSGLFSSFALLNSGATLVFLYNNFSNRNAAVDIAALSPDGTLQLQKLNTGSTGNADWLPRSAKQTDAKEWVIPVLNRNNLFFARVVFP